MRQNASHCDLPKSKQFAFLAESYERLRKELVAQGVPDAQVKVSHLNPKAQVRQMIEGFAGAPVSSH